MSCDYSYQTVKKSEKADRIAMKFGEQISTIIVATFVASMSILSLHKLHEMRHCDYVYVSGPSFRHTGATKILTTPETVW